MIRKGEINGGSKLSDILSVLTGLWTEYDQGDFHVVKTPFFVVVTGNLDKGKHTLPFRVKSVQAALVTKSNGSVSGMVVRPFDDAVDMPDNGLFRMEIFGDG